MLRVAILVILIKMVASDADLNEKYETMPLAEFIEYFNSQNFSWTMKQYDQEYPVLPFQESNISLPIMIHKNTEFIRGHFDSRQQWARCRTLREIYNQGQCGSCWAFGVANTASDRTCIYRGVQVHLSEEDFECLSRNVCGGHNIAAAFAFWKQRGLVSNKCKPYYIPELQHHVCRRRCANNGIRYAYDKHYAQYVYRVHRGVRNIKAEISTRGPVQASFTVYKDFMSYNGGIYDYKFGAAVGRHSVRVLGYGTENGVDYWLVANSWGTNWGEQGYFKIKVNIRGLGFENEIITGIPRN